LLIRTFELENITFSQLFDMLIAKFPFSTFFLLFCLSDLQSQTYAVTFRVDMSAETVASSGVHIAGSFQSVAGLGSNWNPGATLVEDLDGDKVYEITVLLPTGTYEYKFINGNAWGMDENPPSECSVGTTHNREVIVGNTAIVLPAYPFNGCISKLRFAVNMSNQTVSPEGVHVMGDFQQAAGLAQNWDPSSTVMQDLNGDGTYEIELVVPFGDYQYVFVNGNTSAGAENLSGSCSDLGSNGQQIRKVTFASGPGNSTVFCFNTCETCHPAVIYNFDTEWWNDAVFYEVFVRSFFDESGDGIGDFKGLTQKLDYLNDGNPDTHDDLGITGIWLMPMMKSPSYHGYDVTDYYATEPDFGTMLDFEEFLAAAHARGIKVIIDLVMNHSSSQHPWFTQSANSQNGFRDWYIWSNDNPGYNGPWGQSIWHPENGDYYYGLFWEGMPDLNYTHPPLKEEMLDVVKFWLDKGVDGYRLDAIKYLIEDGLLLENTNQTYSFLEEFNDVYKTENPEAFTVGEVWSSTQSIIPYVQNDRLDVCFEFGLAGAILDAVNNGNPVSIENQLETVQSSYPMLQYATFLTNHDIDRVYSTLGTSDEKMKLAASIYMTLPGIPFLYYGEEIGMTGTGDHLNIRRPMQWTDGNNAGFSDVTPWQSIGGNFLANNVKDMDEDPNSILRHYKKLIRIRNEQEALRKGHTLLVEHDNDKVFSFARIRPDEAILVVSNTGTVVINPTLALPFSALAPGDYFITELLGNQAFGTITINTEGGFSNLKISGQNLGSRSTWILLLSTDNPILSTFETGSSGKYRLTPNPAQDDFQIERIEGISENVQIRFFSADGKLLFQQLMTSDKMQINTANWPAGVYFVQMLDSKKSVVKLLVLKKS
jgi:alpha-amylase